MFSLFECPASCNRIIYPIERKLFKINRLEPGSHQRDRGYVRYLKKRKSHSIFPEQVLRDPSALNQPCTADFAMQKGLTASGHNIKFRALSIGRRFFSVQDGTSRNHMDLNAVVSATVSHRISGIPRSSRGMNAVFRGPLLIPAPNALAGAEGADSFASPGNRTRRAQRAFG